LDGETNRGGSVNVLVGQDKSANLIGARHVAAPF